MYRNLFFLFIFSMFPISLQAQSPTDSLLNILRTKKNTDTTYLLALVELANTYRYDKADTSLLLAQQSLEFSKKIDYAKGIGRAARVIGIYYRTKGNLAEAIVFLKISVEGLQKAKDIEGLAFAYNSLAAIYKNQANTVLAVEYCLQALKEFEKINNAKGIVYVLNNLVNIYVEQGNYEKGLEYAQKCLTICETLQDNKMLFYSYFNLSEIYQYQKQYEKALGYQLKNLRLAEKDNDKSNIAYACNNISFLYIALQQYNNALPYLQKGLQIASEIKSEERKATLLTNFASYYNNIQDASKAFVYANEALQIAKKLKNVTIINNAALENSIAASKIGKYKDAYESYQLYKQTTDSLQNEKKYKESMQKDFAYQKEKDVLEQQKKEVAYKAELEQQKIIRNSFIIGFLLMFALTFLAYISYRNKQKTNKLLAKQQEEISASNKELNQANEELYQQQEELMMLNENIAHQKADLEKTYHNLRFATEQLNKSIEYASHIQNIILPEQEQLAKFFADTFIIYQPRDVVSGDFYWFSQISNDIGIFILADCTGHGVPGAFMSMLGNTLLHEIINVNNITNPSVVLRNLHIGLESVLKQKEGKNRDGMDISVCVFEKNTTKQEVQLTFSGAKSMLYYVENANLVEIRGDKQYIGGQALRQDFINQVFTLPIDTAFYLFSDGFADQNNEQRIKLGYATLKQTIMANHHLTFDKQREILLNLLQTHQGEELQRDDISLVALKIEDRR